MTTTAPFNGNKTFSSTFNDLKTNPEYVSQLNRLQKCLNLEINARQQYLDAFMTRDSLWWKNEISSINQKIGTEKDPFTADMYKRIKGFWGIACYSLGNQAVKEKDPIRLKKIVTVYHMLEPENSYAIYLTAFLYYWKGDKEATAALLKKALEKGFTDIPRLRNDFPQSISSKLLEQLP